MNERVNEIISLLDKIEQENDRNSLKKINTIIQTSSDFDYLFYKTQSGKRILDCFVEIPEIKYNLENLIFESKYLIEYDGKTIIEYLLESGIDFKNRFLYFNDPKIFDSCVSYCDNDVKKTLNLWLETPVFKKTLLYYSEEFYLNKIEGKTIFEYLLDNGFDFSIRTKKFKRREIIDILLQRKEYFLLNTCDNKALLQKKDLNNTYLDSFIESASEDNKKFYLNILEVEDNELLAQLLLVYAKHDKLKWILNLTSYKFMSVDKNKVRLVDELLKRDEVLSVENILSNYLDNLQLYVYLRLKQLKLDKYNMPVDGHRLSKIYLEDEFKKKSRVKVDEESKELLNKFKNIMLSDGKSDKEIVRKTIISYKEAIKYDKNVIKELEFLIQLKEKYSEFCIKKTEGKSNYHKESKTVYLEQNATSNAVYHEFGHLFFHLLADSKLPDRFEELVAKRISDPKFMKRVFHVSKTCNDNKFEAKLSAFFYYNNKKEESLNARKEIWKKRLESKQKILTSFAKMGYDEKEVEKAFEDGVPTYEECAKYEENIVLNTLINTIVSNEKSNSLSISDIVDAMMMGQYYDGKVEYEGKKINGYYGHGEEYYNKKETKEERLNLCFNEIIANYASIIKSKDAKNGIEYLRSVIGDELFNLIEDFYNKEIRNSKIFEKNEILGKK